MTSSKVDHARNFGRNAALYARLRPDYPKAVFDALLKGLSGPRGHAVDLGAGAGQATLALADSFERVTAIEPDARMIAEIPERANVETRTMAAEAAAFSPASIDAVIAATSFHWMDQGLIVARVHDWLRPGGAFFAFAYGVFDFKGAARAVFDRHAPLWGTYKDERLLARYDYRAPIAAPGLFASVEPLSAYVERVYSPTDAAGLLATASYATAYARDQGGGAAYFARVADELSHAASEIVIGFPIAGVLAVKAAP